MNLSQTINSILIYSVMLFSFGCSYPRITNEIIYEGNQFYQRQDYQNALNKYLQAYKQEPKNPSLLNNLGVVYSVLNKNDLAIKYLKEAICVDKKDYIAHYTLASIYLKQNNPSQALDEAITAKNINNKESQIFEILGNIYMAQKNYSQAIESYSRLNDLEPYEANYHILLGKAYFFNGQKDLAYDNFAKAQDLDSESKEASQWLVKCQNENEQNADNDSNHNTK